MAKATVGKVGDTINTLGYYVIGDGGAARYTICAETGSEPLFIRMNNRLYAKLILENEMDIMQFGAYNDGITDSKLALQAALDSSISVLTFPKYGEIMIRSDINARINKKLVGNNCTILTDNEYVGSDEMFIRLRGVTDFEWNNLNITALQTKDTTHWTQIGVQYSSNVSILNSVFIGPQATYDENGPVINGYCNIDVWTGWENVVVDNCTMILTHDGPTGCNLMARDINNTGELRNLRITNNKLYKICHDEMIAIGGADDRIRNVLVSGNEFYARDGKYSSSDFLFSLLGSKVSTYISDIVIENNIFDVQSSLWLFHLRNMGENVSIRNNDIKFIRGKGRDGGGSTASGGRIFYESAGPSNPVNISDNKIAIDNTGEYLTNVVFTGYLDVKDNNVTVNGSIATIFSSSSNVERNTVAVDNNVNVVFNNCMSVIDNTANIQGYISTIFRYDNRFLVDSVFIAGNTVTASQPSVDPSIAMLITNSELNDYIIELRNNVLDIPVKSTKDYRYNISSLASGGSEIIYLDEGIEIDVSLLSNAVYFGQDNYFSSTLTNTQLKGGITIVTPKFLL